MANFGFGSSDSSNSGSSSNTGNSQSSTTGVQSGSYSNGPINSGSIAAAQQAAQGLYNTNIPEALTEAGLRSVNDGAAAGVAAYNSALPQLQKTLSGGYLDPKTNPGFQSVIDSTIAAVRPGIDSGFEAGGRYGSPLAARAVGQGVGSAVGGMEYANYNNERQNQMTALGMVPSFAVGATTPGAAQITAGMTPFQAWLQSLGINVGTAGIYNASNGQTTVGSSSGTGTSQGTGSQDNVGFAVGTGQVAQSGNNNGGGKQ